MSSSIIPRGIQAAYNNVMVGANSGQGLRARAVRVVFDALWRGTLHRDQLVARELSRRLGHSTFVLYHHFGSLDGFLIQVDGKGWQALLESLLRRDRRGATVAQLARGFVEFAFRRPVLYWLMTERPFDRAQLRRRGRLRAGDELWEGFVGIVARHGSQTPQLDARALLAGLHGLVALTASGRGTLGNTNPRAARRDTYAAARRLASALLPGDPPCARNGPAAVLRKRT
ncbi:MAG: TetR-like C-terminal domain-containing protein [Kofleriaceae bacterium]